MNNQLDQDVCNLINFTYRHYDKWHTVADNSRTKKAVKEAVRRRIIRQNIFGQVKHILKNEEIRAI